MRPRVVHPPKLVWITGFGNPTQGFLVEWRQRSLRGRASWEGLIVHVVNYSSQDGAEWSIRVDWLEQSQFKQAN